MQNPNENYNLNSPIEFYDSNVSSNKSSFSPEHSGNNSSQSDFLYKSDCITADQTSCEEFDQNNVSESFSSFSNQNEFYNLNDCSQDSFEPSRNGIEECCDYSQENYSTQGEEEENKIEFQQRNSEDGSELLEDPNTKTVYPSDSISHSVSHLELKRNANLENAEKIACPSCNKIYSTKGNLKTHLKVVHQVTDYRLDELLPNQSTKPINDIPLHMKMLCPLCKQYYKSRGNLRVHLKGSHNLTLEQARMYLPFNSSRYKNNGRLRVKCPICDKWYMTKQNLKLHIKNKHKDKNFSNSDIKALIDKKRLKCKSSDVSENDENSNEDQEKFPIKFQQSMDPPPIQTDLAITNTVTKFDQNSIKVVNKNRKRGRKRKKSSEIDKHFENPPQKKQQTIELLPKPLENEIQLYSNTSSDDKVSENQSNSWGFKDLNSTKNVELNSVGSSGSKNLFSSRLETFNYTDNYQLDPIDEINEKNDNLYNTSINQYSSPTTQTTYQSNFNESTYTKDISQDDSTSTIMFDNEFIKNNSYNEYPHEGSNILNSANSINTEKTKNLSFLDELYANDHKSDVNFEMTKKCVSYHNNLVYKWNYNTYFGS